METSRSECDPRLDELLAVHRAHFQRGLVDEVKSVVLGSVWRQFPREQIEKLHFGYEPVQEVYLLRDVFDQFFPPQRHLSRLASELGGETSHEIFLEALGCYIVLDDRGRESLNSHLQIPLPHPDTRGRHGVILICWDRIEEGAKLLQTDPHQLDLLHVVVVHEHSHAARQAGILNGGDPELLRREETIAQQETYMLLRSLRYAEAIEAMKKLMMEQPNCYQIPIP